MTKTPQDQKTEIKFLIGVTTKPTKPDDKGDFRAELLTATGQDPLDIFHIFHEMSEDASTRWLTLLAAWASKATGSSIGIPAVPTPGLIPAGTRLETSVTPEDMRKEGYELRILHRFRILFPLNENGIPSEENPQLGDFDPEWHRRDIETITPIPLFSYDGENGTLGFDTRYLVPAEKKKVELPETAHSGNIRTYTGQETDALFCTISDGRSGRNFKNLADEHARVHQVSKSHYVRIELTEAEREAGLGMIALEAFTEEQDADGVFACGYALTCLTPPPGQDLPSNLTPTAWLDLDDIADKIGLYPDKCREEERVRIRSRIWKYIQFAERAQVIGKRSTPYRDKKTGEVIPTEIKAFLWRIMGTENDIQPGLFSTLNVPRRVQLTLNRSFAPLLVSPNLSQFMDGCEKIAAIPGGKPSGAWARVVGLTLLREWRMKPREAMAGTLHLVTTITRRSLLTSYAPKGIGVDEVLNSNDPKRARGYWRDAIQELAAAGLIQRAGEALKGAEDKGRNGEELPRKGWQEAWLDTPVVLLPGIESTHLLGKIANGQFVPKPKELTTAPRKRGRPPKNLPA